MAWQLAEVNIQYNRSKNKNYEKKIKKKIELDQIIYD
jgi:hypothetical protein